MRRNTSSDSPRLQTFSREAFWQRHVTQWRDSGLSKMAYCQQYSLVYHQMVYWCSKAGKSVDDVKIASTDFVTVTVSPTYADSGLSVRLPNGISIEGIDEHSVALVGKLIEQL